MKSGSSRSKSPNDWLAEMMSLGGADEVPPGWLTIAQMCKMQGSPTNTMKCRVDKLLHAGKLQRKKFRIDTGAGVYSVWHDAPAT